MLEGVGALHAEPPRGANVAAPRLAEATALFAVVTDLATGVALTVSLRTCLAAMRIADLLDDSRVCLPDLFHYSLVKLMGCTAETSRFAAAMGDELRIGLEMGAVIHGSQREMMTTLLRSVGAGEPLVQRGRRLATALAFGARMRPLMAGHCEVARMLTQHLGLGDGVSHALDHTYERWDGKGSPAGARGDESPLIARITAVAYEVVVQERVGDADHVRNVVRERGGHALDPRVASLAARHMPDILDATRVESPWESVLAVDPAPAQILDDGRIDMTVQALALFADLKADHLAGHSTGLARLVARAAPMASSDAGWTRALLRAASIHDLGRVAVSTVTWQRDGPLSDDEWEAVRLHPYHLERATTRVPWLAAPVATASRHHERLDGSGYHRGAGGTDLDSGARLLAAADAYQAMTEARPHRRALSADGAMRTLRAEVAAGRLDRDAAECVLAASGHARARMSRTLPAVLTEREVEVLRIIAAGATIKDAARRLHVSPKTIDAHVQHIYTKVGCTSRAGAAVFAMRHGLLEPDSEAS